MPRLERIPTEIRRQIERHEMLAPHELALVAVSGGADSVCLLHAMHDLSYRIMVAHLDHGIRGAEAEADAEFVRRLAEQLDIDCLIERRDVPAYQGERKLSLEAAAREVRYAFLGESAARCRAAAIFVAHTADDQVETFLLRLIRGAGVAGLSGMRPKEDRWEGPPLCRPMLGLWRKNVEAYLNHRQLSWREDTTNRDRRFLRNRARHELLPLLETMNPAIKKVLLREVGFLARRQQELETELLRQLGLSSRQIQSALAGTLVEVRGSRRLKLDIQPQQPRAEKPAEPFNIALPVPGIIQLPGIGLLSAKPVRKPPNLKSQAEIPNCQIIDAAAVGSELRVRSWRPGDRFVPLGMSQPKKLQDFFVDGHIPRQQRSLIPLLVAGDAIVWVVGMRIDDRFKLTPQSRAALRLQFVPE